MADYYTQFSAVLNVNSGANVKAGLRLYGDSKRWLPSQAPSEPSEELGPDDFSEPSLFEVQACPKEGHLWLHDGGYGSFEHVPAFVFACAERFGLTGLWGFRWALTCSSQSLDGFGGGAIILDLSTRKQLESIDCHHWLESRLHSEPDLLRVNGPTA